MSKNARDAAERSTVASMMLIPELIPDVVAIVEPTDFSDEGIRTLFLTAAEMHEAGERVDPVTVADRCNGSPVIAALGGYSGIADIYNSIPHGQHGAHHAEIVVQHSIRRMIHGVAAELSESAGQDYRAIGDTLSECESTIHRAMERHSANGETDMSLRAILIDGFARIGAAKREGVTTGLPNLDKLLLGWQPGHLNIVAARPGVGKTAFALNVARSAAMAGTPVLFFSLEQSRLQLAERLLALESRVSSSALKANEINEHERDMIMRAATRLSDLPVFIADTPAQNVNQITALTRLYRRRKKVGLVIIDYLQHIQPSNTGNRTTTREQSVADISRRLFAMARQCEIPVLVLAQLNRQIESRGANDRPRLSDLRESGQIEQDANVVAFLRRPWVHDPISYGEGNAQICVAKNRDGKIGDVWLEFHSHLLEFVEGHPWGEVWKKKDDDGTIT